jgi:hypothetical protein
VSVGGVIMSVNTDIIAMSVNTDIIMSVFTDIIATKMRKNG